MSIYNDLPDPKDQFDPIKGFFDLSSIEALDDQLAARAGKENLIDKLQTQSDAVSARRMEWSHEFKENWYLYVFLIFSALFTGTLGVYMGLSPALQTDAATGIRTLHFNTDFMHIVLAIVYFLAFVGNTEFQYAVAKYLYKMREENNQAQKNTMIAAMIIGVVGIVGTGMAGAIVVASNISFLTEFVNIPAGAQGWVVKSIPLFIGIYTVLYSIYANSSEKAKAERIMREIKRKNDLAHKTRMDGMIQIADVHMQGTELNLLMSQVEKGNLSRSRAIRAIKEGKSLTEIELEDQKDIDRDGLIGTVSAASYQGTPTYHPVPMGRPAPKPRTYTLKEFCDHVGFSEEVAVNWLAHDRALLDPGNAYLTLADYLPSDMTRINFDAIHAELVGKIPSPILSTPVPPNGNHPSFK